MLKLSSFETGGVSLAAWISYKRQDCGLQELREQLGDDGLLSFIELYPGSYLRVPPGPELLRMARDLQLAKLVMGIRVARKAGNLDGVIACEKEVARISKRFNKRYSWCRRRGADILRELVKTRRWLKELAQWRQKFLVDRSSKA